MNDDVKASRLSGDLQPNPRQPKTQRPDSGVASTMVNTQNLMPVHHYACGCWVVKVGGSSVVATCPTHEAAVIKVVQSSVS